MCPDSPNPNRCFDDSGPAILVIIILFVTIINIVLFIPSKPVTETTTVRLVGGHGPWEGRVEIRRNGPFGTVCDDYWDDNDAAVICRMLGYSGGKAWVESRYGQGSGSIWLDNVNCTGNEDDVFLCQHRGWGIGDCDHSEDAGVSCQTFTETTVRLVGGHGPWEGRVEIKRNGPFGTVCDDYWDDNDAAVICRMLGYSGGKAWVESCYGHGSGSIWLDNVDCKGNEDDVFLCQHRGWGIENCDHTQDAGVSCQASTKTTVRLVGGHGPWEGRVEIKRNGPFGTVCDDYWDDNDATVICRMLGYSGGKAWVRSHYGQGPGSIWLDNVDCNGTEDDVFHCQHRGWGTEDCDHTQDAGVSCQASTKTCGPPSQIGRSFQLSLTLPNVNGTLSWWVKRTTTRDTILDCFGNDTCLHDPDMNATINTESTGDELSTYNTTLSINTLTPAEHAADVAWYLNDMLLGECVLYVFSFDSEMTCSEVEFDESGSKVTWNCSVSGVFPNATCRVEYVKHEYSKAGALPPLTPYTNNTASDTKPGFVDSVCFLEMPVKSQDTGTYSFRMSMQPDVLEGRQHGKSVQSNELILKDTLEVEESDSILVAIIFLVLIMCVALFMLLIIACRECRPIQSEAGQSIALQE